MPKVGQKRKQLTISDLYDGRKLAAWLGEDPEEVVETTVYSTYPCRMPRKEHKTRAQLALVWLTEYRRDLKVDFAKSKGNHLAGYRSYTHFIQECLSKGLGLKTGTVAARIKKALAERPDLYSPPEEKPCRK